MEMRLENIRNTLKTRLSAVKLLRFNVTEVLVCSTFPPLWLTGALESIYFKGCASLEAAGQVSLVKTYSAAFINGNCLTALRWKWKSNTSCCI